MIDKKSGEDITRNILLQIIIEQEDEGEPLFTTEVLEQIIGFYGNSVQGVAGDFLSQSLKLFRDQQERFQTQVQDAMQTNPLSSALNELTRQNLERWQQMQDSFFTNVKSSRSKPDDSE